MQDKEFMDVLNKIVKSQDEFLEKLDEIIEKGRERDSTRSVRKKKRKVFAGFYLVEKWSIVNGDKSTKRYSWYATRSVNKKRLMVYVGRKKGDAKNKIKAWLDKHPDKAKRIRDEDLWLTT